MSHINNCQKTPEELLAQRVTCQLCNKSYARASIKIHLATAHVKVEKDIATSTLEGNTEESFDNSILDTSKQENCGGRKRRKAAEKAKNLIQEVIKTDPDGADVSEMNKDFRVSIPRLS